MNDLLAHSEGVGIQASTDWLLRLIKYHLDRD